ncbi:LLM class flavin-dependent oxidoreductase [Immundisolibacter sp.]|uniref:LLM class flavin-dependent oxidoreductase n=1 Tax=Immundisolibacter sp. TaxID=1934948 RepID=UPI002B1A4EED|nr:LLM class flavin-dependent oxidoreductase [Immundisolibacter sp.]MEA3220895.1 F420-dependent glucose-6-phosphate dehydrogenase [Immundisolibacter sp.]
MKFGIYNEIQASPGANYKQRYDEALRSVELGDALGYDVFMTLEHHFFPTFSISVNPLAFFAAAAQRTRNIRFRAMCHTLPVHNPLVLAGEIAQCDHLTDGRLEVGVGRGHGWLFDPASVPMADSIGLYEESLEILQRAWSNERFSFEGKHYKVRDVQVVPKPLQPSLKIFQTGTSARVFGDAARKGWGVFVGAASPPMFAEAVHTYANTCKEVGNAPHVGLVVPAFLAADEATAHREAEQAMMQSYRNLAVPQASINSEETKARLREGGFHFYAGGFLNQLNDYTYDYVIKNDIAFVGTPTQFVDWLARFRRQYYDFQELAVMGDFGGLEEWQIARTLTLFAREVMPALR